MFIYLAILTQPNQKAWISITKTQPTRWVSAQILMRPLATVSTLAHRHASSGSITQRSSRKATKWRFQSTFERPVRRGNDFNRVRTPGDKHVLNHLLATTFIHQSLHRPNAAHEAIGAWMWHRWYNGLLGFGSRCRNHA